jgi:hypothetical protein
VEVLCTLMKLGDRVEAALLAPPDLLAYWDYRLPNSGAMVPSEMLHGVIIRLDQEGKEGFIKARFVRSGWRTVSIETIWCILHSLPTSRLSRVLETDLI